MLFTRSSSRLDDSVSSICSEVLDSILKKAIPLSGFSWSKCAPCWNQASSWLTVMRFKTSSRLFRKGGTASGVITTKASHRSRMYPWEPWGTLLRAWVPSDRNLEVFRSPTLAKRSPSFRNRPVWLSSTCWRALGTSSRHVLTSRQLVSIRARDIAKNGSRSRPMAGRTSRPNTRHSPATS